MTDGGRLTTHVLDLTGGRPAAGLAIELVALGDDGSARHLAAATTNVDGRTDAPLLAAADLRTGAYELRFAVGAYFAAQGHQLGAPPFLDVVPVRFGVADADAHHHVPLLVTPWSYSTYRGS